MLAKGRPVDLLSQGGLAESGNYKLKVNKRLCTNGSVIYSLSKGADPFITVGICCLNNVTIRITSELCNVVYL